MEVASWQQEYCACRVVDPRSSAFGADPLAAQMSRVSYKHRRNGLKSVVSVA